MTILDIETLAQDKEVILSSMPPWSEEEARTRLPANYKKPETISAWLESDRESHGSDVLEKAALTPEYARIAIVGFWKEGRVEQLCLLDEGKITEPQQGRFWLVSEAELIEHAFMRLTEGAGWSSPDHVLGWNLHGFDLAMLVRRAWILGVPVPSTIFNPLSRYHFPDRFVDMMAVFKAGNFKAPHTSLNNALRSVGLPEKGDGKEFGKLWQEDRAKALEYSATELRLQSELYRKMGVKL